MIRALVNSIYLNQPKLSADRNVKAGETCFCNPRCPVFEPHLAGDPKLHPSRPLSKHFRAFFPLRPIYEKDGLVIAGKSARMLN